MERITGPFNGFYIALFASDATGNGSSYLGYAKVCRGKPDNFWDAHCCARLQGQHIHTTPYAAMNEVERLARQETGTLAHFVFARSAPGSLQADASRRQPIQTRA